LKEKKAMTTIKISGMNCGHCTSAVSKALNSIDGIEDVEVNLDEKEATFNETKPINHDTIKTAISMIGFTVEPS
jgi:copper chaperone CopZ